MTPVLGATLCRPSTLLAVNCSSGKTIDASASTRVWLIQLPRSAWKLGRRGGKGRNVGICSTSDGTGWGGSSAQIEPLDLTEENVEQVLLDARSEVRTKSQLLSFLPQIELGMLHKNPLLFSYYCTRFVKDSGVLGFFL